MILTAAVLSILAVTRAVNVAYDAPEVLQEAERCLADLQRAPLFAEDGENGDDA